MLRIIPAIDLLYGMCVRLTKGDYQQVKIYEENPLKMALFFQQLGADYLHLVDLEGAKMKKVTQLDVLKNIIENTSLQVDFGGGIKTDEDLESVFEAGVHQVTLGSVAVNNPEMFERGLKKYGAEKIMLGADVRNGKIAVSGWLEDSEEALFPFLEKYLKIGIKYVVCTDISKDGMMAGANLEMYNYIIEKFPEIRLIASGGVDSLDEIKRLNEMGMDAVIVGKALYEKRIDPEILFSSKW